MEQKWETLDTTYCNIVHECNELSNMLFYRGNTKDGGMMREIHDRMELVHYKAETALEFIKILKAAEAKNIDLGDEINGMVSFHYINLISDLDLDIEDVNAHYFANMKCYELFCRWKKLCGFYKNYLMKTVDLPKGIDLSPYKLANEISE